MVKMCAKIKKMDRIYHVQRRTIVLGFRIVLYHLQIAPYIFNVRERKQNYVRVYEQ